MMRAGGGVNEMGAERPPLLGGGGRGSSKSGQSTKQGRLLKKACLRPRESRSGEEVKTIYHEVKKGRQPCNLNTIKVKAVSG